MRTTNNPRNGTISRSQTIPSELSAEAARRLPKVALILSATYLLNRIGQRYVGLMASEGSRGLVIQDVFDAAAVSFGVAVLFLARSMRLRPPQKLQLGEVFLVFSAFWIALTEFWQGFPIDLILASPLVPVECPWIIAFPLMVPNSPQRVLKTSLLAASMGPAALVVSAALNGHTLEKPWLCATYFLCTNYLSALFAFLLAKIVYRVGARLTMAREIGSYELTSRIGEGGMGEVWQGRHRLLARPAAIKLIRPKLLVADADARSDTIRRFEREAQATATLGSVHTIEVYDYGVTEDGDFYYVMELLNGISLDRYVKQFGPMAPGRAIYLLRQVCHSLEEAHCKGLIHRDIKPANIFMCRRGPDDDFVKVLDFGLVKHFGNCVPGTLPTVEDVTAGTPAFMAPEMILSDVHVDGRADIYAVGCVAYYLLTGETVFGGESAIATMLAHVKDAPIAPSKRSKFDLPVELERLVLDCLSKDKASRPSSAAVVSRRLAECRSAGVWTDASARAWWQTHQQGVVTPRSEESAESKRCRPCLERKEQRALTLARGQ